MRFGIGLLVTWTALGVLAPPAGAIPGIPDDVPAATLVAPFFEVDPSGAQDTLLVVNSASGSSQTVHRVVWDVNGTAVPSLSGSFVLGPSDSASFSMRQLVSASAPAQNALLRDGRWRGFVTFDVVTSATSLLPTEAAYPFGGVNVLEGWIYFTRLTEGSSNGLAMIPVEFVGSTPDDDLHGFYRSGDGREEIDSQARECSRQLASGSPPPCAGDVDGFVDFIDSRVFLDPGLGGQTRIVVFAWSPGTIGGPGGGNAFALHDEAGTTVASGTVGFADVVTVIDVPGTQNGWAEIQTSIPSTRQVYAFAFNSAKPGSATLNWDAIFVSRITP